MTRSLFLLHHFELASRLWLLQYRKPGSSIQTCRWPRRLLSGKQNRPLRIDTVQQRWSFHFDSKRKKKCCPRFPHSASSQNEDVTCWPSPLLSNSPDLLSWQCHPLDIECQCPMRNLHPLSVLRDWCWKGTILYMFTNTVLDQEFFQTFL